MIPRFVRAALGEVDNGHVLLSSDLYLYIHNNIEFIQVEVRYERAGPSMPSPFGTWHNDVLKAVKIEISSHTVKNILLWLTENNQQAQFNESSLLYWLREGLEQLRTAILKIKLPYCMIPERNLMAACGLDEGQTRIRVETITCIINEDANTLLRMRRIRKAIIWHPEPLLWYNKKRVELELLSLKYWNRLIQCMDENRVVNKSEPMLQAIESRIAEIVREVRQRMNWEGSRLNDLVEIQNRCSCKSVVINSNSMYIPKCIVLQLTT
ncbi:hypothetical protein DPMN_038577 [Dreissena polymorpha]|uniref:Uncharacterized protein n=1 Tax=Dreissena polymorpha TaxID=45954 RepID=A0A9D4MFR1_DREPO|nr:hypothetical protein DPMN_038577 [Dreissena polymorpha]